MAFILLGHMQSMLKGIWVEIFVVLTKNGSIGELFVCENNNFASIAVASGLLNRLVTVTVFHDRNWLWTTIVSAHQCSRRQFLC